MLASWNLQFLAPLITHFPLWFFSLIQLWDMIAGVIHENYSFYDGFVITHGTDTMAVR